MPNNGDDASRGEQESPSDPWVARFEQARASVPGFRVESSEELGRITRWYREALANERPVHSFHVGADLIHCVDLRTQWAVKRRGIKEVPTHPEVVPGSLAGSADARRRPSLDFGLDGLLDDDGRVRECPEGTFPKLVRTLESNFTFARLEHILRKSPAGPKAAPPGNAVGHEWAHAYRYTANLGARASFDAWSPTTQSSNEFSLSQLWITAGTGNGLQTIEAGWQHYNQLYGDDRSRLFIYSTQDNYSSTGCYNTQCGIFVQTSSQVVLGGAFTNYSSSGTNGYHVTLQFVRDAGGTHDWWLRYGDDASPIWVGYYPNSLYNSAGLANQAAEVDFGGEIYASDPSTTSTDMGSGQFPSAGATYAAFIAGIKYVNTNYTLVPVSGLSTQATRPTSWNVGSVQYTSDPFWGTYFYFGGPGNTGCQCTSGPCCDGCHYRSSGTLCRAATGSCDVAEYCSGSSASCPSDTLKSNNIVCRPAAGECDVAEYCTGSSPTCPSDTLKSNNIVCRPAAGECDAAEVCTGSSATCPPDALLDGSTVCRPAAGECDTAEVCTGSSATCPPDVLLDGSTVCRPVAGECDVAEACTGDSVSCPVDVLQPDGTACADGICSSGACQVSQRSTDASDEPGSCACREAGAQGSFGGEGLGAFVLALLVVERRRRRAEPS